MIQNYGIKDERNILHKTKRKRANWIGHRLCMNCLLRQAIKDIQREGTDSILNQILPSENPFRGYSTRRVKPDVNPIRFPSKCSQKLRARARAGGGANIAQTTTIQPIILHLTKCA